MLISDSNPAGAYTVGERSSTMFPHDDRIGTNRNGGGHFIADGEARPRRSIPGNRLRSQTVLLPDEIPAEYDEILAELKEHFGASDDLAAQFLIHKMAGAEWGLRRCRQFQAEMLGAKIEELNVVFPGAGAVTLQVRAYDALLRDSTALADVLRQETRFENQYDSAYRALKARQKVLDRRATREAGERTAASGGERQEGRASASGAKARRSRSRR
jgi:hypothetical protein